MTTPPNSPLNYLGIPEQTPPNKFIYQRAPTPVDYKQWYVGDIWINTAALNAYIMVGKTVNTGTWMLFGVGAGGFLATLTGDVGGAVAPDAFLNINFVGTPTDGILVTGVPGTNTMQIDLQPPYEGGFIFQNTGVTTPLDFWIQNFDAGAGSYAALDIQTPNAGEDPMIRLDVAGGNHYCIGIDNSVAGDPFMITNGTSPGLGLPLIAMTNAGVITLANDLDVTEGGSGVSTLTLHGFLMGNAAGDIQATVEPADGMLPIGVTGGFPVPATLTAGVGIVIANAPGAITINSTGGGMAWQAVGVGGALAVNNGYVCNAGGALVFTLPLVSIVGDRVCLGLSGSVSWQITQAAGQRIRVGNIQSTLGAGGSVTSTDQGDTIALICYVANTLWIAVSYVGNLLVV